MRFDGDKRTGEFLFARMKRGATHQELVANWPEGRAVALLREKARAIQRQSRGAKSFDECFGEAVLNNPDLYQAYCEETGR